MGNVKIPYYVVLKGRGYWRPTPTMKALGFVDIRCGEDGPKAWSIAARWNERWQATRKGGAPAPSDIGNLKRDEAEAVRVYPQGSVGAAFQSYIRTEEWTNKALSNRNKVWWPCWFRIRDMWGDVDPNLLTFEDMSTWRADLERTFSRDVAHRTLKIWRALWNVMLGMKIAIGSDPSRGIRNRSPLPRSQKWSEGEAVRMVKCAIRHRFHGLACVIAIAWDTQFSPVDARSLRVKHCLMVDTRLIFNLTVEGRAKTGRAAIGTVSRRTQRLIEAYLASILGGAETLPDAVLFRNRAGNKYREDTLADDFASVRRLAFPGDMRRLMDMRRSGTVEAVAGGALPMTIAAKMANTISSANELHRTYAPVDIASVRSADDARLRGRRKLRE